MKKIITILVSCSLALAASAMAQQEGASPTPNKKQQRKEHAASEAQSPAGRQAQEPGARPHAGRRARERVPRLKTPTRRLLRQRHRMRVQMAGLTRRPDSTKKDGTRIANLQPRPSQQRRLPAKQMRRPRVRPERPRRPSLTMPRPGTTRGR